MKKLILLLTAALLSVAVCYAQNTEQWFSLPGLAVASYQSQFYFPGDPYSSSAVSYETDTLLCDRTFKVYRMIANDQAKRLLRIEGDKVYQHHYLNVCDDGHLLYDFDLQVGDFYDVGGYFVSQLEVIDKGETFLLNGEVRPYLALKDSDSFTEAYWINGIGDVKNGLFHAYGMKEGGQSFTCAKIGDELLWENPNAILACEDLMCPTVRSDFDINVQDLTCALTNKSVDAETYSWDFGDGTVSTETDPLHTYDSPGCYTITLITTSDCNELTSTDQKTTPVCIGADWQDIEHPATSAVSLDFVDESIAWAITYQQIWKTTDGAATWTEQYFPPSENPNVNRQLRGIKMFDENRGLIVCANLSGTGDERAILYTADGGDTWNHTALGSYLLAELAVGEDGMSFAVGQYTDLYVSTDFGVNWGTADLGNVSHTIDLQYFGDQTLYSIFYYGGSADNWTFNRSYSSGLDWDSGQLLNPDELSEGPSCMYFHNPAVGFIGGYPGKLLYTENEGIDWTEITYDENLRIMNIDFADELNGWAVGEEGLILYTYDGGLTWLRQNCGNTDPLSTISAVSADLAFVGSLSMIKKTIQPDPMDCSTAIANYDLNSKTSLLAIPNPAKDQVRIIVEGGIQGQNNDVLQVLDIQGRIVLSTTCQRAEIQLDASSLANGLYQINLIQNGHSIAQGSMLVIH